MNKAQLIDAIAKKANLTKADAKKALDAFIEATTETLKAGDKIALVGFGTFGVAQRAARKGRNPQKPTQVINIPAKKVVKFTVGSELKNAVK
ncbi:MAG: HU family DNA-binding protein [Bacteroidales bacterium]|jgi:DNA-binding protein HU-beta|nr:HU family DNA-binding protein [Bacteroidales bacterium]HOL97999.1 HU family DNA-binding protein [Bacteroidales bacterium]HOM36572.1 HU family DNA-binding protein [Bacteroidales bacterium]HPD23687.1 HU family DNA-binding protein [Bacteroidales bacterium]HRS99802.1 HU family DNA-binding protein [Bacteroidales bacterium]